MADVFLLPYYARLSFLVIQVWDMISDMYALEMVPPALDALS